MSNFLNQDRQPGLVTPIKMFWCLDNPYILRQSSRSFDKSNSWYLLIRHMVAIAHAKISHYLVGNYSLFYENQRLTLDNWLA